MTVIPLSKIKLKLIFVVRFSSSNIDKVSNLYVSNKFADDKLDDYFCNIIGTSHGGSSVNFAVSVHQGVP